MTLVRLPRLLRDDEGQDLIEYALLLGLISLVAVAALISTGTNVNSIFTQISGYLGTAAGSGS